MANKTTAYIVKGHSKYGYCVGKTYEVSPSMKAQLTKLGIAGPNPNDEDESDDAETKDEGKKAPETKDK